jgi:hypothetical protein
VSSLFTQAMHPLSHYHDALGTAWSGVVSANF